MSSAKRTILASILIVAVGGGAVVAVWVLKRPTPPTGLTGVWAALGGVRPIEGRLSGGLPYARYEPVAPTSTLRGRREARPVGVDSESVDFLRAAAALYEERDRAPSVEAERRVAAVRLLRGDAVGAVERLGTVLRDDPDNVSVLVDLATARLQQARVEDRPVALVDGLEAVERALELSPSNEEALFTRAALLERLNLAAVALTAWNGYIERDPDSQWSVEARQRVASLSTAPAAAGWPEAKAELADALSRADQVSVHDLVARFPHPCRMYARNELLPAWANGVRAGDETAAARATDGARRIGDELVLLQQDGFLRDAVAAIDRASTEQRAALVEGYLANQAARAKTGEGRNVEAAVLCQRAVGFFTRGGDDANRLASLRNQADAALTSNEGTKALDLIRGVAPEADRLGYPQISGAAWWLIGTIRLQSRQLTKAQQAYETALGRLRDAGFTDGEAAVSVFLAIVWGELGNDEEMVRNAVYALGVLATIPGSYQATTILNELAYELSARGRHRAALVVQNETVRLSEAQGDAFDVTIAQMLRAKILIKLERVAQAREDLTAARARLGEVPAEGFRERVEGDLLIAEAEADGASNLASVEAACAKVQETFARSEDRTRYLESFVVRARARRLAGDTDGAESDLRACVADVLRTRSLVSDPDLRISFFDARQDVFDEMIAFQCGVRSDPATGFAYSEAARARGLLDRLEASAGSAAERGTAIDRAATLDLQQRLAADVVLVEYAWTGDGLVAWVVGHGQFQFYALDAPADLEAVVRRYRTLLERGVWDETAKGASEVLYDVLIRPFAQSLGADVRVVIVPDKALWDVPFATLRDREQGRFLVEQATIDVAPSGRVFLANVERDRLLAKAQAGPALVIGDPAIDGERIPGIVQLPNAETEARVVASLYPGATLVVGRDATKDEFLKRVDAAGVIHFAGHALPAGGLRPEAGLVFAASRASETTDDEMLTASEIARLRVTGARLVVLAACRTGGGQSVSREGSLSIARAWLVAGVPSVAATLWDVDDYATSAAFIEFHRRRQAGQGAAAALRSAMLTMLDSPFPELNSPAAWGAFQILGGHES